MLEKIKAALAKSDVLNALNIIIESPIDTDFIEVQESFNAVLSFAKRMNVDRFNKQYLYFTYLSLILSILSDNNHRRYKSNNKFTEYFKLQEDCINIIMSEYNKHTLEEFIGETQKVSIKNDNNNPDQQTTSANDNNNTQLMHTLPVLVNYTSNDVLGNIARWRKDKTWDVKNHLNFSEVDLANIKNIATLYYFINILCAAVYPEAAAFAKPELKAKYIAYYKRLGNILNQMRDADVGFLSRVSFDTDGFLSIEDIYPLNAKSAPRQLIQSWVNCLCQTTLSVHKVNYHLYTQVNNNLFTYNDYREIKVSLKSELECQKDYFSLKSFDHTNDLLCQQIPLRLLFIELAACSHEFSYEQLSKVYMLYPSTPKFKFSHTAHSQIEAFIQFFITNQDAMLKAIKEERINVMEMYDKYIKDTGATSKAKVKAGSVKYVEPSIAKCFSLFPYFIISQNNHKSYDETHLLTVTTYNEALIKFAYLANYFYELQQKGNIKADVEFKFVQYTAKHPSPIEKIIKQIDVIYQLIQNLNFDESQAKSLILKLHQMIEDIYSEFKYINNNTIAWLNEFTDQQIEIYSCANNLTLKFSNSVHKDIFQAEFAAIHDDKQLKTSDKGDITIVGFRGIEMLRTKQLESKCRANLKKLQKPLKKTDAQQTQFSGEMNIIYDDKPEDKTTYDKRKTRKTLTPAEIQQKISAKKKEQKPSKVKKSAAKKSVAPAQANTVNNNNNNSNNQHLTQQTSVVAQPIPVQAAPQKLEVVSFSSKEIEEPIFIRPKKEVFDELALPLQYQWQLDTAYNEIIEHPEVKDQLNTRYFVLYNAIRMLQASLSIAKALGIKNTPLYKQILILRNMLADRMEYILDPNSTNEDFLSTKNSSIFMQIEKIYLRLQKIVHFDTPTMQISVESNPIHKTLCSNGSDIDNVPDTKAHALLSSLHEKLDQRLKLFMAKLSDANQLITYPMMTGAVKMMLCEVGALARRLRDGHPALCGKLFNTNLTFQAYPDALVANNQNNNSRKKKDPKRLLPYLKTLNSDETYDFLKQLTLGQLLTLMIEVRNTIGHDMDEDWQDCPEEVTTHLAFDLAKHILTRITEIQNVLNQITPDDKPKLQVTSQAFVPTFLRNQTTLTPLNVAAEPFQPRSNMNPNSGTFVPGNRSVTTGTLFNQNTQPPNADNNNAPGPSGQSQWENNSNNLN